MVDGRWRNQKTLAVFATAERPTTNDGYLHGQGGFALLPVAGAEFVRLQRVEYAQDFRRATTNREVRYVDEANDVLRIDDKCRALCNARGRIQNSELLGEFTLDVREHRERKVLQIDVIIRHA